MDSLKIKNFLESKIYEIMELYKTQLLLKDTRLGWQTLTRKRSERFGIFSLKDAGNFYNF